MNLVIFPGNSLRNKEWADDAEEAFSSVPEIDFIYKHHYKHWETGDEFINLDTEIERFKNNLPFSLDDPYIVFAKSAGTLLTLYGNAKGIINPKKSLFVGMPTAWAKANNVPFEIEDYEVPTLVIQNTNDPITSHKDLKEALASKDNFIVIETEGNTHEYLDFQFIKKQFDNFN